MARERGPVIRLVPVKSTYAKQARIYLQFAEQPKVIRRWWPKGWRTLQKPMRRKSQPTRQSGKLRHSIRLKKYKRRESGVISGVTIGAFAPHGHLITAGHRIVTHSGRFTGKYAMTNPFVGQAINEFGDEAFTDLQKGIWKDTTKGL